MSDHKYNNIDEIVRLREENRYYIQELARVTAERDRIRKELADVTTDVINGGQTLIETGYGALAERPVAEWVGVLLKRQREKRLDWYRDVYDFHVKFNCLINDRPTLPPENTARLRADMEREELRELHEATEQGDLAGIADAIADLIYVLLGRAVSYGIDMRPVWEAVHQANMAKVGGSKRSDGKVMKPEGWEPPDIEAIIARQALNEAGYDQ